MNKFLTFIMILLFLSACQSAKDVLTLKKKNTADEFLVEKKSPLVVPPDFDKLPTPSNKEDIISSQDEPIGNLTDKNEKKLSIKKNSSSKNKSIESTILDKIR